MDSMEGTREYVTLVVENGKVRVRSCSDNVSVVVLDNDRREMYVVDGDDARAYDEAKDFQVDEEVKILKSPHGEWNEGTAVVRRVSDLWVYATPPGHPVEATWPFSRNEIEKKAGNQDA